MAWARSTIAKIWQAVVMSQSDYATEEWQEDWSISLCNIGRNAFE